jgi:multisubunit Na+/H+ antiporter MnhC subunit
MNVFLFIIWIFLFSCYMYLLTHEPSIPLYSGDRIILNPVNLALIVGYSAKFPSIFRSTFVETIVILHMMSNVLGWYPTLFFFI